MNNIPPPNHHNQSNFAPNQDNTSTPTTTNLSQNIPQLQQPQLMQQLQQQTSLPAPKPPTSTPVNNQQQTAKINILPPPNAIPNVAAVPPITTKTELPQISPTGNNNKSNINLNHLTTQNNQQQQQQMMQQLTNNSSSQQSSLMNMNIPNTQQGQVVNMMSSVPQASAALLAQQNASNLNQIKHQAAQFGMNVFNDSLEHTLASLVEQQPISNQKNDMAMLAAMEFQHQQKMMMSQLPNGFGDFNGVNGVNNLMNMLAMPNMDPNNLIFNAAQMKSAARSFSDNSSAWQTNNPMIKSNSSQSNVNSMQLPSSQQQQQPMQLPPPPTQQQQQQSMPQPSPKAPKAMLTPKPIEELMNNPNERSKSMSGASYSSSSSSSSFSKSEQNLKNASSWSQLGAGSPQNMGTPNTSTKSKVPSTDTFQEFKNKAKEQSILRQRQEQEKMKKIKEQELKRQQQESLQKQKINDDLSNGHK